MPNSSTLSRHEQQLLAQALAIAEQRRLLTATPRFTNDPRATEMWDTWLVSLFPKYFQTAGGLPIPFAAFHHEFWEWVWDLHRGVRPDPFIAIWSRAAGKSTSSEIACVALGARQVRRYVWYISATQELADAHVNSISSLLESPALTRRYPLLSNRRLSKFGKPRAWRRNRLWTAAGLVIDALGLDTAARGVKVEEQRPDFICLDDVDDDKDSPLIVEKKISAITRRIIPAGAADCAILGVQNLVHGNSIFARLADGRADFLIDRKISGPYPALTELTYEQHQEEDGKMRTVLTGGVPTWDGMNLDRCQGIVNDIGLRAFLAECQHEKTALHGTMYGEVFHPSVHVLPPFPIPPTWWVDNAHDWGSSAPFATLWFAEANGEAVEISPGVIRTWPKGTLFVIAEDYGWNGKPNEGIRLTDIGIGQRIRSINLALAQTLKQPIRPGPADTMIFNVNAEGKSIAAEYALSGVHFLEADKRPGSRVTGWKHIYDRLEAANAARMEHPGLFIFATCKQLIRTLPLLPRDARNPDDVDDSAEDHLGDALRYRVTYTPARVGTLKIRNI